jgi:hypothetical protein
MATGRDLDAEVAEWVYQRRTYVQGGDWSWLVSGASVPLPEFSTDLRAAWSLVEKLRAELWEVQLSACPRGWSCLLFPEGQPVGAEDWPEANAETVEEAICRAAIAAAQWLGRGR